MKTISYELSSYEYNFNGYKYITNLYDTPTSERTLKFSLSFVRRADIIIYTIDLEKENTSIKNDFIDEIKQKKDDIMIYVVGNKLDKIEEKDITKQYLEKFRNQASELIEKKRIDKYFEISALTGEGVDNLVRHLKIDSAIISKNKKYDELKSHIVKKIYKSNKIQKLNEKGQSSFKDMLKEREKLEKLNSIFKYMKY